MKPVLLILAAGMGSRYGSLKQIDAFGPSGETIMDYSIYDAVKAGFGKIVFVISPSMEEEFTQSFIKKYPSYLEIDYVLQSIEIPQNRYPVSPLRKKPWGTAHAVLMGKPKINVPFAVINADDFYGSQSYSVVAEFLNKKQDPAKPEFSLVGYQVQNVLSDFGAVSRGVCTIGKDGYLEDIVERTKISKSGGHIVYTENGEEHKLHPSTLVSMNMFGFTPAIFGHIERYFEEFLRQNASDPKSELFIPLVIDNMTKEKVAKTKVLKTEANWFGVTYKDDKPFVKGMINALVDQGKYPVKLW